MNVVELKPGNGRARNVLDPTEGRRLNAGGRFLFAAFYSSSM